jgi:DHA3 family macrolide efflux protein-like MFS transporter
MVPFFIVWTGQAFSLLGSSLVRFALIWWLTESTGSATVLTVATMMTTVPRVFLSPVTGTLVDRWNRRLVIMVADGAIALATVVLVVLFALDVVQVWLVLLLMFIRAIGSAFHGPAMMASTTLMVPEKHYSRIAGLNNALGGTMNIVAPPLGALLLDIMPMQGILTIDVGTALLAIVPLFFILIPQPERSQAQSTASRPSVLDDLREGLRFIWGWPGLMMLVGVYAMVHLLLAPSMALMPILVTDHFGGGALQLAWLQSAVGIGLVAGGLTLGVWGGFKRRMVTAMLALALMGIGMAAIGVASEDAFPLAVGGLFFVGFTVSFVTSLRLAILQASVPPEMQGRVITLALNGTAVTDPVGLAIAGPLADTVGVRIWYVLCGIVTTMLGVGAFFVPAIMRLEDRAKSALKAVKKVAAG